MSATTDRDRQTTTTSDRITGGFLQIQSAIGYRVILLSW